MIEYTEQRIKELQPTAWQAAWETPAADGLSVRASLEKHRCRNRRFVGVRRWRILWRDVAVDGDRLCGATTDAADGVGALGVAPVGGARGLEQVELHHARD